MTRPVEDRHALTSTRRLVGNTMWNLMGSSVVLAVGVVAMPFLVNGLGTERYGVMALAIAAIGYFGLFDLGLGRALSKLVAEYIGHNAEDGVPALVGTALAAMAVLGTAGGIIAALITPLLVHDLLAIPPDLADEVEFSFYLLAATVPILTTTAGARAVFEAYQRFGLLNAIKIPLSITFAIVPLVILSFTNNLAAIVAGMVFSRAIDWAIHMVLCLKFVGTKLGRPVIRREPLGVLLSFGGWMTVSNIVGPIMVYFDRFLIGAVVSMTAVSYYTVPFSVVTQLWIIPGALLAVLFPALSTLLTSDRERAAKLITRGVNVILLSLAPAVLIIVPLASPLLELWIGAEFAKHATPIMQWLMAGILINSVAHVPFAFIQAQGRPDLTAKLHLAELAPYIVAVWGLTSQYGAIGAAIAWTGRVFVDTTMLFIVSERMLNEIRGISIRLVPPIAGILTICGFSSQISEFPGQVLIAVVSVLCYVPVTWFLIMDEDERKAVAVLIGRKEARANEN